ncbi:MAG TPA: SIR2 family protein [Solirubrobacteraceae bacterium]|nr:SIR2 family protein [Solirubrobacteraceae bacterium]
MASNLFKVAYQYEEHRPALGIMAEADELLQWLSVYFRLTTIDLQKRSDIQGIVPAAFSARRNPDPNQPPSAFSVAGTRHDLSSYEQPLAYGFCFDEIRPNQPSTQGPPILDRSYYDRHARGLYRRPIIKLHGSLNWLTDDPTAKRPTVRLEKNMGMGSASPLIITPLLYKSYRQWPFPRLWEQAAELLRECRRLVIVGYSFPATDFEARALLRKSRAENPLESLIVVNPSSRDRKRAAEIVNHREMTHFDHIEDFLVSEGLLGQPDSDI